jgi:hypothetical protein
MKSLIVDTVVRVELNEKKVQIFAFIEQTFIFCLMLTPKSARRFIILVYNRALQQRLFSLSSKAFSFYLFLSWPLSISLFYTHTHTHAHTYTLTHTLTLTHTHTLTHKHTHSLTRTCHKRGAREKVTKS